MHFTNAPTDPQYQRMGVTSGTDAGWLRLPDGDTAPYLQEIRDAAERHGLPFKLVSAVVVLCHELGCKVVAEGIETKNELSAVMAAGADYGQGYLLARPAFPLPPITWPEGV